MVKHTVVHPPVYHEAIQLLLSLHLRRHAPFTTVNLLSEPLFYSSMLHPPTAGFFLFPSWLAARILTVSDLVFPDLTWKSLSNLFPTTNISRGRYSDLLHLQNAIQNLFPNLANQSGLISVSAAALPLHNFLPIDRTVLPIHSLTTHSLYHSLHTSNLSHLYPLILSLPAH